MGTLLATFLVSAAVAAPVTGDATAVTATSATLNGTAVGATTASFEYGTSTTYGVDAPATIAADGSAQATVSVTPNTTYHFRIVADTGVGADKTFTTRPNPTAPGVTSQHTRDITATSANISASLNPHGAATTYYFQYGTTTSYGGRSRTRRPMPASGRRPPPWRPPSPGCGPYTRYHWRLVATNAAGTTRGPDQSFTTARAPTAVSLGARARPSRGAAASASAGASAGRARSLLRSRSSSSGSRSTSAQGDRDPGARAATAAICSRSTACSERPASASSRARRRSSPARW